MNICTCVLYHEVLVYGVRHIRNRRTTRRVYGCTSADAPVYRCIRDLHDRDPLELFTSGFPRLLIPLEFVSWRQCAPLERA